MENEKFQELVLQQLQVLTEGQKQLAEGQKQLSGRLESVEKGQARLENRIELLDNRMEMLENRMEMLENRMEVIENRMESLENRQTKLELRLENEVVPKINALFDGYQLRGDQIENLKQHFDDRLDALAFDVNFAISGMIRHEAAIRELRQAK
ncbi:MAG: hypothetical protein K6U04_07870 [Armatimonadetes bacterium]|nr:hypothetical protein [Armatimonadota bacterium]